MSLDINKAGDFAALTLGSAASLLQALDLAGRKPAEWDILEGSYLSDQSNKDLGGHAVPVLFHVFKSKSDYGGELAQIQDTGGRRKVKYTYPYVDGQTTDDLGGRPESFDLEVLIHGTNYSKGLKALLREFNASTPGTLIHPIRGPVRVVVDDVQQLHKSDTRKAVMLRVVFSEHTFTISSLRAQKDTSVKGVLSGALAAFAGIQNAILQVTGAVKFATSLKNAVVQSIRDYELEFGHTLQSLNAAFNTRGSSDIPGLLPVNEGGTGTPATGANFPVAASPGDVSAQIPATTVQAQVSAALAADQMVKLVNATRAQLSGVIAQMKAMGDGQGSLAFHDNILDLKQSGVALQQVLEAGIQSSRARVVSYTVPRVMSLREVAFANGLSVSRVVELTLLNTQLESVNLIDPGTLVRVPTQ